MKIAFFPFSDSCALCAQSDDLHHHKGLWTVGMKHETTVYCRCLDIQAPVFIPRPSDN